jgi:hypothetical protein
MRWMTAGLAKHCIGASAASEKRAARARSRDGAGEENCRDESV